MESILCTLCTISFFLSGSLALAETVEVKKLDLTGYRTVENAVEATFTEQAPAATKGSAYLGVSVEPNDKGMLRVQALGLDSPAAKAGVQIGDLLLAVDDKTPSSIEVLRAALRDKSPGQSLSLSIQRGDKVHSLIVSLGVLSQPVELPTQRALIGLTVGLASDVPGLPVTRVTKDGPAAKAGVRFSDRILSFDGQALGESLNLSDLVQLKSPGDTASLVIRRKGETLKKTLTLAPFESEFASLPEENRVLKPWDKANFRIAIVGVEFTDVKHNPAIPTSEWEKACFSRDAYKEKNVTGQAVFGSVADYYQEVSCGKLAITGKVFDWIQIDKKILDYNVVTRSLKTKLLTDIVRALQAREGAKVLDDFDGVAFVYAGIRPNEVGRGSLLWPHRSRVVIDKKLRSYIVVPEGGKTMYPINTLCHEMGHMLGLPDLYARPENPGSEGLGRWSLMSNTSRDGRPQHPDAWSKEQMGWITPTVIDPRVKQKLILAPIEGRPKECFKIPLRVDGSEYFLLENRRKINFDASLPADGLLIWRVVANRPILEEAHGVEGPSGPRVILGSVPWPSVQNSAFTPSTVPSSRSQLGAGFPVHITNIQKLPDGRIAFHIGYEFN